MKSQLPSIPLPTLDDIPTCNVMAEQDLLGSIFFEPDLIATVGQRIKPETFANRRHQQIFEAMMVCQRKGIRIDPYTVGIELGEILPMIGGDYLSELLEDTVTSVCWEQRMQSIADTAAKRKLFFALLDFSNDLKANCGTAEEISESHIAALQGIVSELTPDESRPMAAKEIAGKLSQALMERRNQSTPVGLSTGFYDIDAKLGGMQPGAIYTIAARPGQGKTSLGVNIAEHVAASRPVVFFSLEMSANEIVQRMLAADSQTSCFQLQSGHCSVEDVIRVIAAASGMPGELFIIDRASSSAQQIMAITQRFAIQHKPPALIVIDYVQLIRGANSKESRNEQISEVMRDLKQLARKYNAALLLLAQLNRQVEGRTDGRARLSDLRDSGSIEQDSHAVIFIEPMKDENVKNLNIAKNRNGPTGEVKLLFRRNFTKFENYAQEISPWDDERKDF